jgi:multidrug efflux system membrane fusion protein
MRRRVGRECRHYWFGHHESDLKMKHKFFAGKCRGAIRSAINWTLLMAFVATVAGCPGKSPGKAAGAAKRPKTAMPVTVAQAVEKDLPITLQAVGTVTACATVTVKAQVEGQLTAVHLREGQCVAAGDLLFSIDPQPFEVRLKQVQANLAKDAAQLENARTLLARNASVVEKGYVSQEQYDQAAANVAALTASVQADEAAAEDARIQLSYCSIRAPISGCAGEVFMDRGNVVKANDADHPLVVIRQIRPIDVGFFVPERYLPEVRKFSAAGTLTVLAEFPGQSGEPFTGKLSFVDNSVNTATGTILLKATFANTDQALWPGQFVTVTLQLASQPHALVVPSQAVQTGQEEQYVFVLKADNTVDYRPVEVGRNAGGQAVIARGLQAGDTVVTDGQLRLSPGVPVKIVTGLQEAEAGGQP